MLNIIGSFIGKSGSDSAAALASGFASRVQADGGVVEATTCLTDRIQTLKNNGLWSKASAVWLPHGYKEDKLYAVKGGAGADLAFTRAGTRTRKGSTYVEQVPYNLLSRSEEFDNAAWTKTDSTITANSTVAPNGLSSADSLLETATSAQHFVKQNVIKSAVSVQYTFSVYAKPLGRDFIRLFLGNGSNGCRVWYNVSTGIVASSSNLGFGFTLNSSSITSAANGFYRCAITVTTDVTTTLECFILTSDVDGGTSFLGDVTKGLYIFGAQVVVGADTNYFKTTDRFDVPALDYTGSTCPALSLEPARTNLILQSETFDSVTWTKGQSTVGVNSIAGPDGLTTADKLIEDTANNEHYFSQSVTVVIGTTYAFSVYAKAGSASRWLKLSGFGLNAATESPVFDLQNGTISVPGTTTIFKSARMESLLDSSGAATGWYRCVCVFTANVASTSANIQMSNSGTANGSNAYLGDGSSFVYVVGAQLEAGAYATSYIPTTTGTISRIADSVPALLPKGTNQLLQSQTFDNASWTKSNLTPTANDTNAPDGTLTADKMLETITNAGHGIFQAVSKPSAELVYTLAVSVKPIGRDWFILALANAGIGIRKWYNLTTQSIGSTEVLGSGWTILNSTITPEANGFYRLTLTVKTDATAGITPNINTASDDLITSFAGDITKGMYVWGAQLEQGDVATTYVATTTVPVHNSTVIGQTQGTLYFRGTIPADGISKQITINDATGNNRLGFAFPASNVLEGFMINGGVVQADILNLGFTSFFEYKLALTFQSNKVAFFANGTKIGEDLTATVPATFRLSLDAGTGTANFYGNIFALSLLPTALSDAEAIAATT
jgi:hypothetical protein